MAIGKKHAIYQVVRGAKKGDDSSIMGDDLVAENWIGYYEFEASDISEREITGITLVTKPTGNVDFVGGNRVKVSTDQLLYVEGGTWACFDASASEATSTELAVGNKVLSEDGTYVEIAAIGVVDARELIDINFGGMEEAQNENNYIAQGIVLGRW